MMEFLQNFVTGLGGNMTVAWGWVLDLFADPLGQKPLRMRPSAHLTSVALPRAKSRERVRTKGGENGTV